MLKRVGVIAMTLASFVAVIPATASAAERGHENTKIVERSREDTRVAARRDDRPDYRQPVRVDVRRDQHRVIARRAPIVYYAPARTCR